MLNDLAIRTNPCDIVPQPLDQVRRFISLLTATRLINTERGGGDRQTDRQRQTERDREGDSQRERESERDVEC